MRGHLLSALLLLGAADGAEGDTPQLLPPWVVTETRIQPDAGDVRASALVAPEAWEGRAIVTLADAFREIPGAIMQESFGGFEPPRLSIRGSGVQSAPTSRGLALRLDDLPLGLADGSFNSALVDPLLATRVEVQRGLDGWRTAPHTMGGALELRGDRPEIRREALQIEAGSFGAFRARAVQARRNGATAGRAALSFARQDGFRSHSEQERTAALASFGRHLAEPTSVRMGVYHARARYAVPGPLTLAAARSQPRLVSTDVERDQPRRVSTLSRLGLSLDHATETREFDLGLSIARTADEFMQLRSNGASRSRSDDASLHGAFAQRFTVAGIWQQLRLTANATRGWRELQRFRNEAGVIGAAFGSDGLYPTTATLQFEDAIAITPRVVATFGVAQVAARRHVVDRMPGGTGTRISSRHTLPQLSAQWHVSPEAALFVAVTRSAEPPTFDDLVSVAGAYPMLQRHTQRLVAQDATTWEIGARGRVASLAWDVGVYQAGWRNEILRLADARGAARGSVNGTPTTHRGLETAARWTLVEGSSRVWLRVAAAWNDIRFNSDPVYGRGRLAGLPPHLGNADVQFESRRGLFGAIGADWTFGDTRVDHAGRLSYPGRTLVHGRFGWRPAPEWTCFIDVRNIFDRTSIASTAGVLDVARNPPATAIFLPAAGRNFSIGLEWKQ